MEKVGARFWIYNGVTRLCATPEKQKQKCKKANCRRHICFENTKLKTQRARRPTRKLKQKGKKTETNVRNKNHNETMRGKQPRYLNKKKHKKHEFRDFQHFFLRFWIRNFEILKMSTSSDNCFINLKKSVHSKPYTFLKLHNHPDTFFKSWENRM